MSDSGEIFMSSQRHTTAAWVLVISLVGFAVLVFNGVSEARKNSPTTLADSVIVSSDSLPIEDPNAQSVPIDRPAELQSAPDDSAPLE